MDGSPLRCLSWHLATKQSALRTVSFPEQFETAAVCSQCLGLTLSVILFVSGSVAVDGSPGLESGDLVLV
jgi:hypothetical protein